MERVTELHRLKTGALIRAAVRMGGMCAGATEAQMAALTVYGEAVGLAFQLQDDVLDAEEDAAPEGPPSFVKLLGLEGTKARAQEELARALQAISGLPDGGGLERLARYTVERTG